jgi:hypothetical protein
VTADYDPDGPVPDFDPLLGEHTIARGRASVRMYTDPIATARQWRELGAARNLSLREVIIEVTGRQHQQFVVSAAIFREPAFDVLEEGLTRFQGAMPGEDRVRGRGGEFPTGVGVAGLEDHRPTPRAARHVEMALDVEVVVVHGKPARPRGI